MQIDTTASDRLPGLRTLGISARSIEEELQVMIGQRNPAKKPVTGSQISPPKAPNPGDEAAPGTVGTGEDICPKCHGSGTINGARCGNCGGTGKITEGIGGV